MTLGQKQRLFARLIAELISWAYEQGYEVTCGDAFRDPRVHGRFGAKKGYGRKNSCHKLKLAMDLNLFIEGRYQKTTKAHHALGKKWESMHSLCRWGGRFNDGNHYSMTHWGVQ